MPIAAASMVADLGMGAATQVVFTATGAVAFSLHGSLGPLARGIVIVCVVLAAGAGALVFVARVGTARILRWLPMFAGATAPSICSRTQTTSIGRCADIVARRADLSLAFALHLVGWFSQAFETWLILRLISAGVSAVGRAGDREPGAGRAQRRLRGPRRRRRSRGRADAAGGALRDRRAGRAVTGHHQAHARGRGRRAGDRRLVDRGAPPARPLVAAR